MARYYFDVINSEGPMPDHEGEEIPSYDDVRARAWQMARDLADDELPDQNSTHVVVNVRDEFDVTVFSAELNYSAIWRS